MLLLNGWVYLRWLAFRLPRLIDAHLNNNMLDCCKWSSICCDSADPSRFDRRDRQDLSVFRLGTDFICRCLALDDPLPSCPFLSFDLVSGG